jgi:hypothetical protein
MQYRQGQRGKENNDGDKIMKTAALHISMEVLTDLLRLYDLDIHITEARSSQLYPQAVEFTVVGGGLPDECDTPGKRILLTYDGSMHTMRSPRVRLAEEKQ